MDEQGQLDYRDPEWVAEKLGIDKNAVYKFLNDGVLPALQIGRKWLISESSLARFLKDQERKQTETRRSMTQAAVPSEGRFERLTDKARRTLVLAQEAAQAMKVNFIGQEHILVGLAGLPDSLGTMALANLGLPPEAIRARVEQVTAQYRSQGPVSLGAIGLTPKAKRVIDLAFDQADDLNHMHVGTEHLVLGILVEGAGMGWGILSSAGITLDKARAEVTRLLSVRPPQD